jgi:hypothetical protein
MRVANDLRAAMNQGMCWLHRPETIHYLLTLLISSGGCHVHAGGYLQFTISSQGRGQVSRPKWVAGDIEIESYYEGRESNGGVFRCIVCPLLCQEVGGRCPNPREGCFQA